MLAFLSKKNEKGLTEAMLKVYEGDSDSMSTGEFNDYYKLLAAVANARVWYENEEGEDLGDEPGGKFPYWPSKLSARNIVARWFGYEDPEVNKYIRKERENKRPNQSNERKT